MITEQVLTLAIMAMLLLSLVLSGWSPGLLFVSAISVCYLLGLIELDSVLVNFTNPSLITLVLLVLLSTAIEKTWLVRWLSNGIARHSLSVSTLKLGLSSAFLSSFTNNTAVVATLISAIKNNAKYSPSKLLLPLSYTAILGGTLTLIGTSTNLIVDGFMQSSGLPGLRFFEFTLVGLGALATGMVVILLTLHYLPDNRDTRGKAVPFYLEAQVVHGSSMSGKTVEENGLRDLKSIFLAEIVRKGKRIVPVSPKQRLYDGDELLFVGDIAQVNLLSQFRGLRLAGRKEQQSSLNHLVEVVISQSSDITGKTLKQCNFRQKYDAVVIAIRRGHERLQGGLGSVVLKPGDSLILAPGDNFHQHESLRRDFVFISGLDVQQFLSKSNSVLVLGGLASVLLLSGLDVIPLVKGLVALLAGFLVVGIVRLKELKRKFPLELFALVGSAIGLAQLMTSSGVAASMSSFLLTSLNGFGVIGAFICIYLLTLLLTELITNNAAAALTFPIAFSLATELGVNYQPFIMAVVFGASASFISPYGYQTNLMVFSAGNYKLADFLRVGMPLSVTYSITVLLLIPLIFPF